MSDRDDGGAAFPIKGYCADATGALCGEVITHAGMSMRDYFAAKAIGGLCADPTLKDGAKELAITAYRIADAMLEARK